MFQKIVIICMCVSVCGLLMEYQPALSLWTRDVFCPPSQRCISIALHPHKKQFLFLGKTILLWNVAMFAIFYMFESNQAFQSCHFNFVCFSQKGVLHTVMFFSAMMGPTLVWLWFCSLRRIAGFATQSTWVASNATGTWAGWVSWAGETLEKKKWCKWRWNEFVGGVEFCGYCRRVGSGWWQGLQTIINEYQRKCMIYHQWWLIKLMATTINAKKIVAVNMDEWSSRRIGDNWWQSMMYI